MSKRVVHLKSGDIGGYPEVLCNQWVNENPDGTATVEITTHKPDVTCKRCLKAMAGKDDEK